MHHKTVLGSTDRLYHEFPFGYFEALMLVCNLELPDFLHFYVRPPLMAHIPKYSKCRIYFF